MNTSISIKIVNGHKNRNKTLFLIHFLFHRNRRINIWKIPSRYGININKKNTELTSEITFKKISPMNFYLDLT